MRVSSDEIYLKESVNEINPDLLFHYWILDGGGGLGTDMNITYDGVVAEYLDRHPDHIPSLRVSKYVFHNLLIKELEEPVLYSIYPIETNEGLMDMEPGFLLRPTQLKGHPMLLRIRGSKFKGKVSNNQNLTIGTMDSFLYHVSGNIFIRELGSIYRDDILLRI